MEQHDFKKFYYNVFIFDLEYIGNDTSLQNCYIWDIGIVHYSTGATFSITVDPGMRPLPKPFSSEFIQLSEDILNTRKATTFALAWKALMFWVGQLRSNNYPVLFMSHNCFKGDKIILEVELKRNKIKVPYDWFFFDTLIFCRLAIPKMVSYALCDLYLHKVKKNMSNAHFALPDAVHLTELLSIIGMHFIEGPIYPFFCTSLQVVKWLGPSCEKLFFHSNIKCLEELKQFLIHAFTSQCLAGLNIKIKDFIVWKMTDLGIKQGNSLSIANSLLERWL